MTKIFVVYDEKGHIRGSLVPRFRTLALRPFPINIESIPKTSRNGIPTSFCNMFMTCTKSSESFTPSLAERSWQR